MLSIPARNGERPVAAPEARRVPDRALEVFARAASSAARSSSPSARLAAIADESVQPVPCVWLVAMRGPRSSNVRVRRAGDVDGLRSRRDALP